jgi:oxalate decarboxylase/phosphoglucose isomerase-like protein (cupin superfamily)
VNIHILINRLILIIIQAEEWLYFHKGHARATVFTGNANSRTFDFSAGDTAVFPDNSG